MVEVKKIRLLIVQYAGDYRETVKRFAEGGGETYYAQKYSIDAVAAIGKQIESAAVLCCLTAEPYNEVVQNGVRAIGGGFNKNIQGKELLPLIEQENPTHLLICTPAFKEVFRWAIKNRVRTVAMLSDSFNTKGLRNKLRNWLLANLLNNEQIEWVANHGINSSISLQKIGVKSSKIIPCDLPSNVTPDVFSAKSIRSNVDTWELIYVGSVVEAKGVGDVLEAIAKLRDKKLSVRLKIAGKGDWEYFSDKAKQLRIEDRIEFLGLVPNKEIVNLMRKADLVVIPSRHEYQEGIPFTIYEALCSRTPIVASDHPMFKNNFKSGINAMVFPAGNSIALSECIEKLLADAVLYENISLASYDTWQRLQIPVKWADMINSWLDNSQENQQWLFEHRLASGRYKSRFA